MRGTFREKVPLKLSPKSFETILYYSKKNDKVYLVLFYIKLFGEERKNPLFSKKGR